MSCLRLLGCCLLFAGSLLPVRGQCTYTFTTSFVSAGGNGSVSISTAPGCVWSVTGVPAWITLTSTATVTNSGTVQFNVQANTTASSRSATLSVANLSYIITQAVETSAPSTPTLTVTPVSPSQLNLSWTASTDTGGSGLAGYKVYRAGVQITTTASTSYSDTGLSASTQYCYTVAAYDNAGNTSSQSSSQCATTSAAPDTTAPSVPSGLTAAAVSSSQINLSWAASTDTGGSGLAGYIVFRGGTPVSTNASASYANTGLSASTQYCYTVAAYDNAGNVSAQSAQSCATTQPAGTSGAWVKGFGGTLNDGGASVAVDPGGNIFMVGSFSTTMTVALQGGGTTNLTSAGSTDMFLLKARPDGTVEWVARYGGTGGSSPRVLILDSGTNIYVGGTFTGSNSFGGATVTSAGAADGFIAKYSAAGAFIWSRTFGGVNNDYVNDISLDAQGQHVIATGNFAGTATFAGTSTLTAEIGGPDTFFLKCAASNGALVWVKSFANQDYDSGAIVCVDSGGNVYLAGIFRTRINLGSGYFTSAGIDFLYDIYIAKFAPLGTVAPTTPIWSRRAGGVGADIVYTGALDGTSDLVLAGSFTKRTTDLGTGTLTGTGVASDIFVAKYSGQSGAALWSHPFKCSYSGTAAAVTVDGLNNVIAGGSFNGTCEFLLGAGSTTSRTSNGADDGFIVRCSGTTGYVQSTLGVPNILKFGGTSTDAASAVVIDTLGGGAGIPVTTGNYQNATFPGPVTLSSSGYADAFLLRRDF